MLGALAGLRIYPHLVGPHALHIRNGATHDIEIPWESIAHVTTGDRSLPSSMWVLQPEETRQGTHLNVAVSGRVNVHMTLHERVQLPTKKGDLAITGLSLWADEPRQVALRIRSHLEAGAPGS